MRLLKRMLMLSTVVVLPALASADVTVTRDSYGVPTISGGNLAEVSRAIGKAHAEDRLWQIFLQNIAANGRLAQYLGPGSGNIYILSDTFQREINPTDHEVKEQIEKYFTENALTAFKNYVKGLNDRVDEVNANPSLLPYEFTAIYSGYPIPYFTLYDNLRSVRLFLQSFSPTQIPQFQLNNIAALQTLATNFGNEAAYAIFEDLDPTPSQVRSSVTIMHNNNATPMSLPFTSGDLLEMLDRATYLAAQEIQRKDLSAFPDVSPIVSWIQDVKDLHKQFTAGGGSNGQAIGPEKSASGYPLLRCAIQPNFNHPGDFYQVKVEDSFFTGNYFIVPGIPFGIGMYNNFGFAVQTGHLPTNDFLIEPTTNISSSREEVIQVAGGPPIEITVYRSSSGGWVIQNPIAINNPTQMLTLRSAFIERMLQGLNIIGELPYVNSVPEFFQNALKFSRSSDIIGFEGQCADCQGNFGAFQATDWTELPNIFDRRLPQGSIGAAPLNKIYKLSASARDPMFDLNNPQGYYSGWNNLFKQFAEGSADTVSGMPLSRAYWLEDYLDSFSTISFDDLKQLTDRQALGNSIVAFKNTRPTAYADLFTPLFKERFFQAVLNNPTTDRLNAIAFLNDFEGNWYDGNAHGDAGGTDDVSDKFILASAWLLQVAYDILHPYLNGTIFDVKPPQGSGLNALPSTNNAGASNDLAVYQGNLLARILETSTDNTLIFPFWLTSNADTVIVNALDTVLGLLGSQPWGTGLRQVYQFKNAIVGPVGISGGLPNVPTNPAETKMFNSSGLYFVTEFAPNGISRIETVIPLGESGNLQGVYPGAYTPSANNFDQLPIWQTFNLIPN